MQLVTRTTNYFCVEIVAQVSGAKMNFHLDKFEPFLSNVSKPELYSFRFDNKLCDSTSIIKVRRMLNVDKLATVVGTYL